MKKLSFIKTDSYEPLIDYLYDAVSSRLIGGERVLLLVPGGSAAKISVNLSKLLSKHGGLANLTVSLTDERYGENGHSDSNWRRLLDMGFSLPGAHMYPVLSGKSLDETVKDYSDFLREAVKRSDYSVALAGMGADGHIFGIKPGSPALDSSHDAVGYEWDDFVRITPTDKLIMRLSEVIIYASGPAKHRQFDKLQKRLPADEQPAQLLKSLRKVKIYNDYKGDME